jgi:hypothetical protein
VQQIEIEMIGAETGQARLTHARAMPSPAT